MNPHHPLSSSPSPDSPSSHERRFGTLEVDILPELFETGRLALLGLGDGLLNLGLGSLVDVLQRGKSRAREVSRQPQPYLSRLTCVVYTHLGLLVVEDTPVVQVDLDTVDSILSRPHPLDLISGSVSGTGVRHPTERNHAKDISTIPRWLIVPLVSDSRVSTVSVGDKLENQRSLARRGPLLGKLARLVDGKNVHTVGLRKIIHTFQ